MAQINIVKAGTNERIALIPVRFAEGRKTSEEAIYDALSKRDGSQGWPIPFWPPGDYTLHINKGDYKDPKFEEAERFVPAAEYNQDVIIELKAAVNPKPAVDLGQLSVSGPLLRLPNGTPFRWKHVTAFDAPRRFYVGELDALRAYAQWTRDVGGNGWRMFGGWSRTGFDFRNVPNYFTRLLPDLFQFLGDEGLRGEFTAICDSIPRLENEQQDFLNLCADVAAGYSWVTLEKANEPWKNGVDPLRHDIHRGGLLVSHGAAESGTSPWPYVPTAGYTTHHSPRTFDWARKCGKDSYEIRKNDTHTDIAVDNEPPGFAEELKAWSRVNNPRHAFSAGVGAGLFCPGMTAHGDTSTMQLCNVPGPVETECARECFRGMDLVPPEAPTWTYARYGDSNPGVPMPIEDDALAGGVRLTDHMHCMQNAHQAVVCNYYPTPGWVAKPANGWRIVSQDFSFVLCER